jgi:hypothetical protein
MSDQKTPGYYTSMAVAKMFDDDNLRQQFMAAYGEGPSAAADFLTNKVGMPADMAQEVAAKQGDELNSFVGGNVCSYLW